MNSIINISDEKKAKYPDLNLYEIDLNYKEDNKIKYYEGEKHPSEIINEKFFIEKNLNIDDNLNMGKKNNDYQDEKKEKQMIISEVMKEKNDEKNINENLLQLIEKKLNIDDNLNMSKNDYQDEKKENQMIISEVMKEKNDDKNDNENLLQQFSKNLNSNMRISEISLEFFDSLMLYNEMTNSNTKTIERVDIIDYEAKKSYFFEKAYIVYKIKTCYNINNFKTVERRFNDFFYFDKYLKNCEKYQGIILPYLPEKNKKNYFKELFVLDTEFIEDRKKKLQKYLNFLLENNYVKNDQIFFEFLTFDTEEKITKYSIIIFF